MRYKLTFFAYCGMPIPLASGLTRQEAIDKARRFNRLARARGMNVTYLGKGGWEHGDDDAWMVGDDQGVLRIARDR